MPYKNNFYKMLLGDNAQIMIAGAVAYTAQANYGAFTTAPAAQGELGVFDGDTLLLVSGGGAASLTQNLFVTVMRDGAPERTVTFKIGEVVATRTPYSAPVKQVTTLSVGIYGTLTVQDITYTARNRGTAGNAVSVINAVAGNSTALSIGVVGNVITVNVATSAGGAAISTAAQIQAALLASAPAQALISSAITGTAATVQVAAGSANLAGGAALTAPTAGLIYEIGILETTPGNQPFPTYDYQYVAQPGDTIDTIINNLVGQINSTFNIANQNRDLILTATYNTTTGSLVLTAINFGVSFRILTKYDLDPIATVTYTTKMHLGSGFTQQVQLFQDAGDIYKGVTTNYPLQGSTPADYGKPSDMTIPGMGYNIYTFTGYKGDASKTPAHLQYFRRVVYVIVPTSGTTPEVQVKAIFGL